MNRKPFPGWDVLWKCAVCLLLFLPGRAFAQDAVVEWEKTSLPLTEIYALAADPYDPRILLAGSYGQGVYRSADGGISWAPFNAHLPNLHIRALVVDVEGTVYVGTYGAGVYRLVAGGRQWEPWNEGLNTPYIYALATNSAGNVYAGTGGEGVFRLTWGSQAWVAMGPEGLQVLALAICRSREQRIYAGTWGNGVFRSEDGGETWAQVNEGLANLNVRAVAAHSHDPDIVYAGTWGGGVYASTNGGETWVGIGAGATSNRLYALSIYPSTETFVYAGTYGGGVDKLIHGDTVWIPYGLQSQRIYSLLTIADGASFTIYAGAEDGVWRRTVTPSLLLRKMNDPHGPVFLGDTITYTLRYTNPGEIQLLNIVLTDQIPHGTTYAEGSAEASGGRYNPGLDRVEWTRDSLSPGASGQVSFAVRLPPPSTPTLSPTGTATPTPTASALPTVTETITATVTPTATGDTPTVTATATGDTPTPTLSPTLTATATPDTVTPTATPTATGDTPTPTKSPTITETPSATATADTPTPTKSPTITETPTATPVCRELLANGNFETGELDGWEATGAAQIVADARPYSRYAVRLGGYNGAEDSLCQSVSLPTDTLSARLSYWWQMTTTQTVHPRDYLYLQLEDAERRFLTNLDVVHDGDEAGRWKPSPAFDLRPYAGQRVYLCFDCQTNAERPTTFYVDDVSLQLCTANNDPFVGRGVIPTYGRMAQTETGIPVFNIAAIYSNQTGWIRSNGVLNSARKLSLPLILKP